MKLRCVALACLVVALPASAQDPVPGVTPNAAGQAALETGLDIAAFALANLLQQSRDAARTAGVKSMPPHIRRALLTHYPPDLLDSIAYRVDEGSDSTVQAYSIRYGQALAVTTIDTITFANPWDAENNIALWAHEVKHVEQFRAWGLQGFASRYVRDHEAVEQEAYAVGSVFKAIYGGG